MHKFIFQNLHTLFYTLPPNEYKEAYDKLQTLYDAYLELTNLAINPTGSLQSYTEKYNNADTAAVNAYQAMQRYIN